MVIYIRKNYTWNGEKYVEHNHRNFQHLHHCRNSIIEYIKDFRQDVNEYHVINEKEYDKKQELLYVIEFSWKGYFDIERKEKIEIIQEYVY